LRIARASSAVLPPQTRVEVAPLIEQVDAEPGALNAFQELLRNDGVGVDVRAIQWRDECGDLLESLHHASDGSM
jgi:hypothetical protein